MGWRTVYIQEASKLSLNLDNLQVQHAGTKYYVALEEIDNVIIEDYKSVITCRLLAKFCETGINVIFTTPNKMPIGAIHSFNNNARTAKYSKMQLAVTKEKIRIIWMNIIKIKINNQISVLDNLDKNSKYLEIYIDEVEPGDITNREGLAARAYYRELFGEEFLRFEDDIVNYSLNYIYQVIRSKIAQEIINKGFHPSFGLFHKSEYNYFNLADDIIEPYRPLCDYFVYKLLEMYDVKYLTPEYKEKIFGIYYMKVKIGDKKMKLIDSIGIYMNSIFKVYSNSDEYTIVYPELLDE